MSNPAPLVYEVVAHTRAGKERIHRYASDKPLQPGQVLRLEGRHWLLESVEAAGEPPRTVAKPARYRIRLRHPDGSEEVGAFRRYRPDAPRLGHSFATIEDGQPAAWERGRGFGARRAGRTSTWSPSGTTARSRSSLTTSSSTPWPRARAEAAGGGTRNRLPGGGRRACCGAGCAGAGGAP